MTDTAATTTTTVAAAVAEQGATVAPEKASSKKGTSQKKGAPKAKQTAQTAAPRKEAKAAAKKEAKPARKRASKAAAPKPEKGPPREGSKKQIVLDLLRRKNGATLAEIMDQMGWQKHTVRGFMAGAMKKAGYTVESFKPEGGERTYRINK
jgi:hypothetical protein